MSTLRTIRDALAADPELLAEHIAKLLVPLGAATQWDHDMVWATLDGLTELSKRANLDFPIACPLPEAAAFYRDAAIELGYGPDDFTSDNDETCPPSP